MSSAKLKVNVDTFHESLIAAIVAKGRPLVRMEVYFEKTLRRALCKALCRTERRL